MRRTPAFKMRRTPAFKMRRTPAFVLRPRLFLLRRRCVLPCRTDAIRRLCLMHSRLGASENLLLCSKFSRHFERAAARKKDGSAADELIAGCGRMMQGRFGAFGRMRHSFLGEVRLSGGAMDRRMKRCRRAKE